MVPGPQGEGLQGSGFSIHLKYVNILDNFTKVESKKGIIGSRIIQRNSNYFKIPTFDLGIFILSDNPDLQRIRDHIQLLCQAWE